MSEEIDPGNYQLVGMRGDGIITVAVPQSTMTRDDALRHAAWLVALAEREEGEFARVLAAVRST